MNKLTNDQDYNLFLALVEEKSCLKKISLVAICLLPTHFHILCRQNGFVPVSDFLMTTCYNYSRRANLIFRRSGTLFQGRHGAKHISDTNYFKHVCRYIHANPVAAGLAQNPSDWKYGDYQEWMGRRNTIHVDKSIRDEIIPVKNMYADFVADQIVKNRIEHPELAQDLARSGMI